MDLARFLDLNDVEEGVETTEKLNYLASKDVSVTKTSHLRNYLFYDKTVKNT